MDFELPRLRREERVALRLRGVYEANGYRMFRMGSFEEYDLYMQNKAFLMGEDIITFTAADGRLLALKPDVTLSIVKNTRPGEVRRLYYNENVFRRSRHTGEYREISQMGLEFIGGDGAGAEAEVLRLAAESLAAIGDCALDLSHMEFVEAALAGFGEGEAQQAALAALRDKSPHGMREAARLAGLGGEAAETMAALAELSGPFDAALQKARVLAAGIPGCKKPLDELEALRRALNGTPVAVRLDFSLLNDVDYYSGLLFQGYVSGIPRPVLAGGRYDKLLRRFGKQQGAVGFALYLDALGLAAPAAEAAPGEKASPPWLNVALPKGRLGNKVYELLQQAGYACPGVLDEGRRLVFEDAAARLRYFLVKPGDVDIYVERGAADIGVAGKDVLLESGADVLELLDLRLGACRLAVAGRTDFTEDPARPLRVATKYPAVARAYYAGHSRSVEIIKLHGSIELAPLLDLADVIVDIVESGATLRENDLAVLAEVAPSSARLIANRASWRFKEERIRTLTERLGTLL